MHHMRNNICALIAERVSITESRVHQIPVLWCFVFFSKNLFDKYYFISKDFCILFGL